MGGNPFFNAGRQRQWKQMRRRQMPADGDPASAKNVVTENWRREEDEAVAAPAVQKIYANSPSSDTPTAPPVTPAKRDWHKFGSLRVTVSNQHIAGQDTDSDSDYAHTITDGMTKVKSLYAEYIAAFPSDTNVTIDLEVHGGDYSETVTCDFSNVVIHGIGYPRLHGQFLITPDCTKIEIRGFKVFNADTPFSYIVDPTLSLAGIWIQEGVESGGDLSDIQIYDCIFEGQSTQAYVNRWSYFENCTFRATLGGWAGSVYCRFAGVNVPTQSKWIIFKDCRIKGYNTHSDYRNRGRAVVIQAIDELGLWYANAVTGGVYPPIMWAYSDLEFNEFPPFFKTGVLFDHCTIDGFTENWGWDFVMHYCLGIEGRFINGTAGSRHHQMFCNSDQGIDAFSWIDHGEIAVRYMVETNDDGAAVNANGCVVFWRHTEHTHPDAPPVVQSPTGVLAIPTAGIDANTAVYVVKGSTHAQFFFQIPVATEGALIFDGIANVVGMNEGYLNW